MIPKYSNFTLINENLQKARSVLKVLSIPETNKDFVKLRALLNRNSGYLGKFTEWMFKDKVPYTQLENLFKRIKGTSLPKQIDEYKSPEEIIDSIIRGDSEAAVNQMIGAIPSRTREELKESGSEECSQCYGSGNDECITCTGDGEIECKACDGNGDTWDKAKKKDIECTKCNGNGLHKCTSCDDGQVKCGKCDGTGRGDGDSPWSKFTSFLALHKDKKDIIIDFLSKKSGRYSDYDDDACDRLTEDISKLLNMASIEDIKKISLSSPKIIINRDSGNNRHYLSGPTVIETPYIKFIYDDERYLIIAVNYEGIKKFGSSYWCIVDDEDTFNDYVTEEKRIQLVLFVKGKTPLVDEQSVMGITMGVDKKIHAAHWEDDDDCQDTAKDIINGITHYTGPSNRRKSTKVGTESLKIEFKNILDAFYTLYDYDKNDLWGIEFKIKELYSEKVNRCLSLKNPVASLSKLLGDFIECQENFDDEEDYSFSYESFKDEEFFKYFKNILKEKNIKLKIDIENVIGFRLLDICSFDKDWIGIDLFDILDDKNISPNNSDSEDDFIVSISKFFLDNKYDFIKCKGGTAEEFIELLVSKGILDISKHYKLISWQHGLLDDRIVKWIIENDFDFIHSTNALAEDSIAYIQKNNLEQEYKSRLIGLLNKGALNKGLCEYIATEYNDFDIAVAAAKLILPPKLLKKFKIDISKLEHLKGFEEFKKLNS